MLGSSSKAGARVTPRIVGHGRCAPPRWHVRDCRHLGACRYVGMVVGGRRRRKPPIPTACGAALVDVLTDAERFAVAVPFAKRASVTPARLCLVMCLPPGPRDRKASCRARVQT